MNILLFDRYELESDALTLIVKGDKHTHIHKVLKSSVGDAIRVGELNGQIGIGEIIEVQPTLTKLAIELKKPSAAPLPLTLIIALPRPQMIKRILQTAATMGADAIHFIQTTKVEKNYWQSPTVTDSEIKKHLLLGLEQAGTTFLPTITKHANCQVFFRDELQKLAGAHERCLLAHPGNAIPCPSFTHTQLARNALIAIGPEGGFTEQEVGMFLSSGFEHVQLGERILRVETAVTTLIAKMFY